MKYKYSVVTAIFNNYENLQEIKNPREDVEYIAVTDNPDLKSSTWTIKIFDKYDKIESPELNWLYVKFFPLDFCKTDNCLFIDGSIEIRSDFTKMIEYIQKNGYEYAASIDKPVPNIYAMINWFAFQHENAKKKIIKDLEEQGIDIYEQGIIHSAFVYRKNTHFVNKIDTYAWNIMKNHNIGLPGYRENQHALTASLRKNANRDRRLLLLDQNILWSPWFSWNFHRSSLSRGKTTYKDYGGLYHFYDRQKLMPFQNRLCKVIGYNDMQQHDELLTLVVRCDNNEKTIETVLNSIKTMSYKKWECIILDKNSIDNSANIILNCIKNDKRFKYISNNNINENVGAYIGNGKYLMYIDGDVEVGEYFCEEGINELEKDNTCCLSTGIYAIKTDTEILYRCEDSMDWKGDASHIMKLACNKNQFIAGYIIKTDRFKSISGFNEKIEKRYRDWDMYLRYLNYDINNINIHFSLDNISVIHHTQKEEDGNFEIIKKLNPEIYDKYEE